MTFEVFRKNLLGESYSLEECFSYDDWSFDGESEYCYQSVSWPRIDDALEKAYEAGYKSGYNTGWKDSKTSDEPWGY